MQNNMRALLIAPTNTEVEMAIHHITALGDRIPELPLEDNCELDYSIPRFDIFAEIDKQTNAYRARCRAINAEADRILGERK